jgi:uncharacterized iron-regulated membrane protein
MRTTGSLIFLMIGCATLTCVRSYAAQSQQTTTESSASTASGHPQNVEHPAAADGEKRKKEGSPSDGRRHNHQVSAKNHPRSLSTTVRDRSQQLPKNRERFTSGNARDLHQTASGKSVGVAKSGPLPNKTVNNFPPVRRTSALQPTGPTLNNARHRGANPAVIGGAAIPDRNTGAINGNRVHRKP